MKQIVKDLLREGRKAGYKGKKLLEYVQDAISGVVEEAAQEIVSALVPSKHQKKK